MPPLETPTAADLVHAGATVAALLACGFVMLADSVAPPDPRRRLIGRVGLVLVAPVLASATVGLIFLGRGLHTGITERAALAVTSLRLIGVSVGQWWRT